MKELANTGMVEVYNHQYLWDNRQHPTVHAVFADVWGTQKLWFTIDRANLNLPIRPGFDYQGFIHWDYDPETLPQNVQGVLALADQQDETMGGFQCVPEANFILERTTGSRGLCFSGRPPRLGANQVPHRGAAAPGEKLLGVERW